MTSSADAGKGQTAREYMGVLDALLILRRAMGYLKPFRWNFYIKLSMMFGNSFYALIMPWMAKIFMDNVLHRMPLTGVAGSIYNPMTGGNPDKLLPMLCLTMLVMLFLFGRMGSGEGAPFTSGRTEGGLDQSANTENETNRGFSRLSGAWGLVEFFVALDFTQRFTHLLRSHLFRRMIRYPRLVADQHKVGDAVFRLTSDASGLAETTYQLIMAPVTNLMGFILNFSILYYFYGHIPIVGMVALVSAPLSILVGLVFSQGMRIRAQRMRTAGADATSAIEEGMTATKVVRAFGQEEREGKRFASESWGAFTKWRQFIIFIFFVFFLLLTVLAGMFMYLFHEIMSLVIVKVLTVGDLSVIFSYLITVWFYSFMLAFAWPMSQNGISGLGRVFEAMDRGQDPDNDNDTNQLVAVKEGIKFNGVGFEYEPGHPVLENVGFSTGRTGMIAIVGPAGSGKSTLMEMVPRLIDPTSGSICIDGRDSREFGISSLRKRVSFVFQEEQLMSRTLYENIAFANPGASEEQIMEAAVIACADEFINEFPEGYDSRLGIRGGKLSVGQKQRIAIARAVLKPSSVIILDQPFSALDVNTEARIIENLTHVAKDRIIFIVDQRLSAARKADSIIVMDKGRVVETGTHDELMAKAEGTYRRLYRLQTGE